MTLVKDLAIVAISNVHLPKLKTLAIQPLEKLTKNLYWSSFVSRAQEAEYLYEK